MTSKPHDAGAGPTIDRRTLVSGAAALVALPPGLHAQTIDPADREAAIRTLVGSVPVKPGRVKVDIPPLAENGNSVPLTITVDSPMSAADHVASIHVFAEKNPIANVVKFHIGPRAGRARLSTNIRLATTQTVTVVAAMSDGSFWSGTGDVIVTLAACIDAG